MLKGDKFYITQQKITLIYFDIVALYYFKLCFSGATRHCDSLDASQIRQLYSVNKVNLVEFSSVKTQRVEQSKRGVTHSLNFPRTFILTEMPTLPLLAGDLRFFALSPALPLWYVNLPLFKSTINIEYLVKNKTDLVWDLAQNLNFSYSQYGFWGIFVIDKYHF